jgi:hypothetical protein
MDKLSAELQRLHFQTSATRPQAIGLAFAKADDWDTVAELCRALQEELDLPAPAISIDGNGFQLWFSVAEAIDTEQASRFLDGLRDRYLSNLPTTRLRYDLPNEAPPYLLADNDERWAAFIDPGMGSLFTGEPWLDMPPNRNQQADLLASVATMPMADFNRVLALFTSSEQQDSPATNPPPNRLSIGEPFTDPKQFLLAVMNDPTACAQHRIDAAKALLPYFKKNL